MAYGWSLAQLGAALILLPPLPATRWPLHLEQRRVVFFQRFHGRVLPKVAMNEHPETLARQPGGAELTQGAAVTWRRLRQGGRQVASSRCTRPPPLLYPGVPGRQSAHGMPMAQSPGLVLEARPDCAASTDQQ
jgi:hypothetical protein